MNVTAGIEPWWVNLAMAVPVGVCFWWWVRGKPAFSKRSLIFLALIGFGFAVLELGAALCIRTVVGMFLGYGGTWSGILALGKAIPDEAILLHALPANLFLVEFVRQFTAAAIVLALSFLSTHSWSGRAAVFFWTMSMKCLGYYLLTALTLGWPPSLATPIVLFLVPVPWLAPVWVPLAASALVILTLLFRPRKIPNP